jgi:RNA polymerase sigma-70 factor (ECF subfamily)
MFNKSRLARETSDGRLIEAFRDGERWAFEEIYRRHRRLVLRALRPGVGDRETADDLAQEVFLKAHRFRESYRPEFALSTWLRAIARNTLHDWLRARSGTPLERLVALPAAPGDEPLSPVERLPSPEPGPERWLHRRHERRRLRELLRGLTRPQRRVVWLRVVRELPYAEIAKLLGMSLDAVKCLGYRARQALQLAEGQPARA